MLLQYIDTVIDSVTVFDMFKYPTESQLTPHRKFWGPMQELLHRAKELTKASGASSEKITERLVRYYMTRGIVDKPDRLGREAAFSLRHLIQLSIAVRLTEKAVPLEMIANFSGLATDRMLEKWYAMPSEVLALRVKEHALIQKSTDESPAEPNPEKASANRGKSDIELFKDLRRELIRTSTVQQVNLADQAKHLEALRRQIFELRRDQQTKRDGYHHVHRRIESLTTEVQEGFKYAFQNFYEESRLQFERQASALACLRDELAAIQAEQSRLAHMVSNLLSLTSQMNEKKE
jgi:signal transduction histidine kinase